MKTQYVFKFFNISVCLKAILIVIVFLSVHVNAQEIFYVAINGNNDNEGSLNMPFRDIQYGIDQVSAGDTLIVMTGTYLEIIEFQGNSNSGTPNNPISLIAQTGVLIDASGFTPFGRQGIITLSDVSFVTIDGFELANFKTLDGVEIDDSPVGILIQGTSTNIKINNNKIHDIQNRSTCGQSSNCGPGANGIAIYGDKVGGITDLELTNNEVFHCVLAASEAFTINGNVDRFKLLNNTVHDNNNIAFDFIGYESDVCNSCSDENNRVRNGYVKNNRAINNSINLPLGGFATNPWYEGDDGSAGGFYVDGGRNIIFDGNYSSQNDMGFEFASEHSGKSSEDILMINNFIYNNREVGVSIGGYAQSSSGEGGGSAKRIKIFNNSFYKNQGWGTEIVFAFRVIDFIASNNIFFGSADIVDNFYQEPNGQNQNTLWMNNVWWAVNNAGADGLPENAPIVANPQFIDASIGNLNIQSPSVSIDNGVMQVDITHWNSPLWLALFSSKSIPVHGNHDINGQQRVVNGVIDIGANEYNTDLIFKNSFD